MSRAITSAEARHIAAIRSKKFGLRPERTQSRTSPLARDLQGAIAQLSEGLYSRDTHFILELLQNAEDNHYREGVQPRLEFRLLEHDPTGTTALEPALLVVNNEVGFTSENVAALCAVGQSTKVKRDGYIGEKGIGFKSVFTVSERPHIFSNGYQFRFDATADPRAGLGYIVPSWVDTVPEVLRAFAGETCVILPLREGKREEIATQLVRIAPETLLFLTHIRRLGVHLPAMGAIKLSRETEGTSAVVLQDGSKLARYWVAEREFAVPGDVNEPKREGIVTRKVSVAIPLGNALPKERVFAYLPTEERSDLPFLINADFIVNASRESVQIDRPWNQWLRSNVAPVYIEAFEGLLKSPEYRLHAYASIPLKSDDRHPFYSAIVPLVQQGLRERPVILADGAERFVLPDTARLAATGLRGLLGAIRPPSQLEQTPLVHPALEPHRERLAAVGVRDLQPDEIATCLRDEDWLGLHDFEWFAQLYSYLSNQSWATTARLGNIPLVLLSDATRIRPRSKLVYFASAIAADVDQLLKEASCLAAVGYIDSRLIGSGQQGDRVERWLSRALGVKQPSVGAICQDLAEWLRDRLGSVSSGDLVAATDFIRKYLHRCDEGTKAALRSALPLVLTDGRRIAPEKWTAEAPLVTPATLDPDDGWQNVFTAAAERAHMNVLSDAYLVDGLAGEDREQWRNFFLALGATDNPDPAKVQTSSYDITEHNSVWSQWERTILWSFRKQFDTEYTKSARYPRGEAITDYRPPIWLRKLLDNSVAEDQGVLAQRTRALLRWLTKQVAASGSGKAAFLIARYGGFYANAYFAYRWDYQQPSTFHRLLLEAAWLPTTAGPQRPPNTFLNRPEIRELLGARVPYANVPIDSGVAAILSIRRAATSEEMLRYLRDLARRQDQMIDISLLAKIYRFLAERWSDDLGKSFAEEPLIYVTSPTPRWVKAQMAIWPDQRAVFGEGFVYLQPEYDQDLKTFFVDIVGVAERLTPELYAHALAMLPEQQQPAEAIEAALERIYPELLAVLDAIPVPGWWDEYRPRLKLWTKDRRFVAADEAFVADDRVLERRFARSRIVFCWRPARLSLSACEPLFRALGLRWLTESVTTSVVPSGVSLIPSEWAILVPAARRAVSLYLWNRLRDHYDRAKESGLLASFLLTEEYRVTGLEITHRLASRTATEAVAVAYWDAQRKALYILDTLDSDQIDIELPTYFARRLVGGQAAKPLEDFLGRILAMTPEKINRIIEREDWTLPPEEIEWIGQLQVETFEQEGAQERKEEGPEASQLAKLEDAAMPAAEARDKLKTGEVARIVSGSGTPATGSRESRGASEGDERQTRPVDRSAEASQGDTTQRRSIHPQDRNTPRPFIYAIAGDPDSNRHEKDYATERGGVDAALAYEADHGRVTYEHPPNHKGWDIDSYVPSFVGDQRPQDGDGEPIRRIEVKATKYEWGEFGVGLSAAQFENALEYGPGYYLYVVEYAQDDERRVLYAFRDPASLAGEFRIAGAWKEFAAESTGPGAPTSPRRT